MKNKIDNIMNLDNSKRSHKKSHIKTRKKTHKKYKNR